MDIRPIDANELIDIAKNKYHDIVAGRYPYNIVAYDLVQIIEKQPTLDLAPVVHGEWVYGEDVDIQCSECGRDAMSDWMKYTQVYSPYCPWCGAKMDGGKKDG